MRQSTFKSRRWFILVAVVLGLISGLLLIPYLIDINTYRGQITSQLEQRLGRSVTLGSLGLSLFPSVKIAVADAAIGDDPQFARGEFIKARSVRLRIRLWSLLTGNPEVRGIELTEPVVALIKGKQETWNWSTLKPLQAEAPSAELAPLDIVIHDGRFTIIDRSQSPPTERTYTGVNVNIKDFSSRSASDFTIALTMPGQEKGRLEMEGTVGPIEAKDFSRSPMEAQVKMKQVELASLEALFGQTSSRQGRLTLKAELKGRLAEGLQIKGEIKAEKLRLVEGTEPSDSPLEAAFALTATSQEKSHYAVNIASGELKLGKTQVEITGQATQLPTNPTVDLQIKGDTIALDGLLESAHAFGFGPPKGTSASGEASVNVRASGPLKALVLNGQSEIRDLKFKSAELPQAIQVSDLKLTFDPTVITASPFRTALGERTTVNITSLSIRNYSRQPRARLEVATQNARVEDLIKIAESAGHRSEFSGTGVANLQAAIETDLGETKSATTITGRGDLKDARLQTPQLTQPLDIKAADLNFTGDSLRMEHLRAQLGQSQVTGWLQVKNFDQPSANFDLEFNQLIVSEFQQLLAANAATRLDQPAVVRRQTGLISEALAQKKQRAPSLTNLRAAGQLGIQRAVFDNLTATDLQSQVTLSDQVINLNPLSFTVYGGRYDGQVRIDMAGSEPTIASGGRFGGVDVNQFLSAASSLKNVVYGRAGGTLDLRGRGRQFDPVVKSLTGQGRLALTDGKITSFDLEEQIALIGKLTGMSTGGAGTVFRRLSTSVRFANGKMLTDDLRLELGQINVTGSGGLQLGDPVATDYDLLAQLSPELTKRVLPPDRPFSVVGNFFMQGQSLVVPLKMSGPITRPRYSLNAEVLARHMTERFRQQPGGAVQDILDLFKRKDKSKPKEKEPRP